MAPKWCARQGIGPVSGPKGGILERETGLEPATTCLEGRSSTTELLPRERDRSGASHLNCSKAQHAGQAPPAVRAIASTPPGGPWVPLFTVRTTKGLPDRTPQTRGETQASPGCVGLPTLAWNLPKSIAAWAGAGLCCPTGAGPGSEHKRQRVCLLDS